MSLPAELHELRSLAVDLAAEAMRIQRAGLRRRHHVEQKSAVGDLVSEVDHEVERMLLERLAAARPRDAVLAEESGEHPGSSGVRWVLDPLDGTANYLMGYPAFGVAIAAEIDGRPVVGVVGDTARDGIYVGTAGGGATHNGEPIAPAATAELARAIVATGFSYDPARRARQGPIVGRLMARLRDLRRGGSAALDLCAVAAGQVDGYFEEALAPWDVAAGRVVAEAAGAVVSFLPTADGRDLVVAANPALMPVLVEALREAGADIGPAPLG